MEGDAVGFHAQVNGDLSNQGPGDPDFFAHRSGGFDGLDMLAAIAARELRLSSHESSTDNGYSSQVPISAPPVAVGQSGRSSQSKKLADMDQISIQQLSKMSSLTLVRLFARTDFNEVARSYSYTCCLIPECQQQFSSFGSESKAKKLMRTHLEKHVEELEQQGCENFTAVPVSSKNKRGKDEFGKQQSSKASILPSTGKRKGNSQLHEIESAKEREVLVELDTHAVDLSKGKQNENNQPAKAIIPVAPINRRRRKNTKHVMSPDHVVIKQEIQTGIPESLLPDPLADGGRSLLGSSRLQQHANDLTSFHVASSHSFATNIKYSPQEEAVDYTQRPVKQERSHRWSLVNNYLPDESIDLDMKEKLACLSYIQEDHCYARSSMKREPEPHKGVKLCANSPNGGGDREEQPHLLQVNSPVQQAPLYLSEEAIRSCEVILDSDVQGSTNLQTEFVIVESDLGPSSHTSQAAGAGFNRIVSDRGQPYIPIPSAGEYIAPITGTENVVYVQTEDVKPLVAPIVPDDADEEKRKTAASMDRLTGSSGPRLNTGLSTVNEEVGPSKTASSTAPFVQKSEEVASIKEEVVSSDAASYGQSGDPLETPAPPVARKIKVGKGKRSSQVSIEEQASALKAMDELRSRGATTENLVCGLCQPPRPFTAYSTLLTHYRSHAGLRPFECSLCQATFTRQHSLKYHMMTHSNQTRFSCDHCNRKFRHPTHYREHVKKHGDTIKFFCSICETALASQSQYKKHLKVKHNKTVDIMGNIIDWPGGDALSRRNSANSEKNASTVTEGDSSNAKLHAKKSENGGGSTGQSADHLENGGNAEQSEYGAKMAKKNGRKAFSTMAGAEDGSPSKKKRRKRQIIKTEPTDDRELSSHAELVPPVIQSGVVDGYGNGGAIYQMGSVVPGDLVIHHTAPMSTLQAVSAPHNLIYVVANGAAPANQRQASELVFQPIPATTVGAHLLTGGSTGGNLMVSGQPGTGSVAGLVGNTELIGKGVEDAGTITKSAKVQRSTSPVHIPSSSANRSLEPATSSVKPEPQVVPSTAAAASQVNNNTTLNLSTGDHGVNNKTSQVHGQSVSRQLYPATGSILQTALLKPPAEIGKRELLVAGQEEVLRSWAAVSNPGADEASAGKTGNSHPVLNIDAGGSCNMYTAKTSPLKTAGQMVYNILSIN